MEALWRVFEHGGHHEAHHGEDEEAREEEFWRAADVDEVAADENPGFRYEGVGELWAVVDVGVVISNTWCHVVILVDCVVAAMWGWCAW